jgi:corrinoid protein of di/trimethylamine methyltransferase
MENHLLSLIKTTLIDGDLERTEALVRQALSEGLSPLTIVEQGLVPGMTVVGDRFASGEYFLPQLVIAARCMQTAMEILQPELLRRQEAVARIGTVVIGTVKGDIHEIGKNLVATMLSAAGFQVFDLGVNVPREQFVGKVKETGADILGLSALLTTTMTEQREVIAALESAGLRDRVKVIIGGAPVNQRWAESIGADGYAEDAVGAVALARRLLGR